jgi:PncC family amidohydrolase
MDHIEQAQQLAKLLLEKNLRVVFAESCTAGLVAATLARTPGISKCLCGSAVTYRPMTKQGWLDVSTEDLEKYTAESKEVTLQMGTGVLQHTPEAQYSAAVTGHLGPNAPADIDGVIYIAIAKREGDDIRSLGVQRMQLESTSRVERQQEAAARVLKSVCHRIMIL